MRRVLHGLGLLLCVAVATGCDEAAKPKQAGPHVWIEAKSVPDWVMTPPLREGFVRVTDAAQSNLRDLAYGFIDKVMARAVFQEVTWRLHPALGSQAVTVARAGTGKPALVRKAYHLDPAKRGREKVVGGQTYTVWVLLEVPLEPLLAAVPKAKRAAAKAALMRSEPRDLPPWEQVQRAPDWASAPSTRADQVPVVTEMSARRADVAKANAMRLADSWVGSRVTQHLRKLLVASGSWKAGHAGARRRVLRSRAIRVSPRDGTTVWMLWDLPIAPILDAVPSEHRDAARTLLMKPSPAR